MEERDFLLVEKTNKGFDQAVVSLLQAIEKKGWTIFGVYDIKERLASKGFKQEMLKIVEFCNAKAADSLLSQNRLVSACMPCRVAVMQEKNGVKLVAMRPAAMTRLFQGIDTATAETIDADIRQILQDAQ